MKTVLKQTAPLLIMAVLLLISCGPDPDYYEDSYRRPVYLFPGVGLGTIIAVVVSWSRNKSILWAIIHGFLGWLYVIYALLFLRKRDR